MLVKILHKYGLPTLLSLGFASAAQADDFKLDYGNVAASDKQITITRLPIFKNDGTVIYKDVIIKFKLNNKGKLAVLKNFPKTTNSESIQSANLVAGEYILNDTGYTYDLIGPGVGPNGREVWTLVGISDDLDMTFYSGPIDGHPLQERINAAGIESSPYTFGVSSGDGVLSGFGLGCMISAHMISDVLKLNSYAGSNCGIDLPNPSKTETFLMCSPDICD